LWRLQKSGEIRQNTFDVLEEVLDLIANGKNLESKFRDHALKGEYVGFRECHIQSDLLLIYKIEKQNLVLILVDIGSHSHLFG
jgi:mRNA interferase YafQ